jgi:hypothetical protein
MAYVANVTEHIASEASAMLSALRIGIATIKKEEDAEALVKTLDYIVKHDYVHVKDTHRAA